VLDGPRGVHIGQLGDVLHERADRPGAVRAQLVGGRQKRVGVPSGQDNTVALPQQMRRRGVADAGGAATDKCDSGSDVSLPQ
jgi:hypothetical protein